MKLKRILVELTVDQSLQLLGLTKDDIGDKQKIKNAFRAAAINAHPDKGGSDAAFRDVKTAFDVLDKEQSFAGKRIDWKKMDDEYRELGKNILAQMKNNFKPENFTKYFESVYGVPFTYKIIRETPPTDTSFSGFTAKFSNSENDIILELQFSAYLVNVKYDSGLGSGIGNISYPLSIVANGLFNDKKLKISQRDWSSTRNHDVFIDPELSFPRAKLEKNKKTSAVKPFKKQDMVAFLTKKYGMSWDGSQSRKTLPLDEKVYIVLDRSVFMKMATWNMLVYRNSKFVREIPYVTFPENIEVAKLFGNIIENASKMTTADEVAKYIADEITTAKQNKDKYWK